MRPQQPTIACRLFGHRLSYTEESDRWERSRCERCGMQDPRILVGYVPAAIGGAVLTLAFGLVILVVTVLTGGLDRR